MNKKILSIACVVSLLSGSVLAAPIDSVEQNSKNGNIIITGDFSAGCKYSVQVLKPGVTPESLSGANDETVLSSTQALINQKTPDGKYKVEIPMDEDCENGTYTVSVNSSVTDKVVREFVTWYKLEEIVEVYENTVGATSADELEALLAVEENCKKLGVSYEMISELSSTEFDKAASGIFGKLATVEELEDLRKVFSVVVTPLAVASAESDENAIKYITANAVNIGISENKTYKEFSELSDSNKKATAARVRNSTLSDVEFLIKELEKAIFLSGIENAGTLADINALIIANKNLLTAQSDKYFTLTNTYSCDNAVMGKSFDSIEALEEALAAILNKPTGTGSGGGGSSSGGSGGSMGGAMISPTVPTVSEEFTFDDLGTAEWAKTAIEALAAEGIVAGKGERRFAPDDMVKREEIVKMLVGAFGVEAEGAVPFTDVPAGTWYYDYVKTAFNSGLVKGISDTQFGTGTNVTRQDMAVLVYRFLSQKVALSSDGIVAFEDKIEISEYARNAVAVLREEGIISGVGENLFMPKQNCTRAQVAYIIYKALKYAGTI